MGLINSAATDRRSLSPRRGRVAGQRTNETLLVEIRVIAW